MLSHEPHRMDNDDWKEILLLLVIGPLFSRGIPGMLLTSIFCLLVLVLIAQYLLCRFIARNIVTLSIWLLAMLRSFFRK